MKTTVFTISALALTLMGTGCATKKYVATQIAPVSTRVGSVEAKNTDQDKAIADEKTAQDATDRDLSHTKEMLTTTDAKASAAGDAAKAADAKAAGAQQTADGARTLAQQGLDKTNQLETAVDGMNKFQMLKSETVLFGFNKKDLDKDAKAQLDQFSQSASGLDRYVIEVQGYTDKTGSMSANEALSQARAQSVARYLANESKVPLRNITLLGSGYANPVGDDKTRDGRKQNRRVELRIFVPEVTSSKTAMNKGGE